MGSMNILAYLDPGSGSLILQMIVGGVAAAGVALKLYWHKVLRFLRLKKDDPVDTTPATPGPDAVATTGDEEPARDSELARTP